MLELIKEFLSVQNWQFSQLTDKGLLLFGIGGVNGSFQCVADVIEEKHEFVFFSFCGSNTPPEKRSEMLDLLNRLNYKFFLGNFEMSHENGEIRFKTNLPYEFIEPNLKLISQIIINNIGTMDKCLPGILGVMFGNLTPTQAFEIIAKQEAEEKNKITA